jgi:hypothetical protein
MGQRSRRSRPSSLTTSSRLEVRILKVVQSGFDQLPQGEGLGAPGQLGELIEPLLGRRLQPHSGGHAITWIHRCILGRVPVPYALGLIRQSLERQLDDIPEAP